MNIVEKIAAGTQPTSRRSCCQLVLAQPGHSRYRYHCLFCRLYRYSVLQSQLKPTKISLQGISMEKTWRSLRANSSLGVDIVASGVAWNLFISVAICE